MVGKTSTIWYVDVHDPIAVLRGKPENDVAAAEVLAKQLRPDLGAVRNTDVPITDGAKIASPDEIAIGCYPGVTVVCSTAVSIPRPSTLPGQFVNPLECDHTYLVTTDPAHKWGAFAVWNKGSLRRCFSATVVHILEDHGLPMVWEGPFWAGKHPQALVSGVLPDPQTLPFDPQQFADAANQEWLGFHYADREKSDSWDPAGLTVSVFSPYREVAAESPPADQTHDADKRGPFRKWLHRKN